MFLEFLLFFNLSSPCIFIYGDSATFREHFGKYGEIDDIVIMKDRNTHKPRGFGFVTFRDHSVVDKVIEETQIINGKQVSFVRTSNEYNILFMCSYFL